VARSGDWPGVQRITELPDVRSFEVGGSGLGSSPSAGA
jgi:hypothetical protein